MRKLPQRPRSHIQQKESRLFVERILPAEWKVNIESKDGESSDYGLDLAIEIIENSTVTGAHFLMQLKSTDKLVINKKGFISHPCKSRTLQYFLERPELVVYLVYDTVNDIGYWIWVQDFLRNQNSSNWKNQQTFTVRIPKDNVLNKNSVEKIMNRVLRNHKKEKLVNTIETLNHPGIRYKLELDDKITRISAFSKYPGAAQDYPLNFGLTLNFDNSEDGKKAQSSWEDAFKRGTPAEIGSQFIKEFKIPKELNFDNLLDNEFKPDGLLIQPLKRDRKFIAKIEVFDRENNLVSQVPYVEFEEDRYGTDEVLMSNKGQKIPAKFSILMKIPEREAVLSFNLNYKKWNVSQVKDTFNFQQALALGGKLVVVHLETHMQVLTYEFSENLVASPLEIYVETADNLDLIQQRTKTVLSWPDEMSMEDYHLIKRIVGIITSGESLMGKHMSFSYDKASAQKLAEAFSKAEYMRFVLDGGAENIILFGQDIKLGPIRVLVGSAKLAKRTLERLSSLDTLPEDAMIKIELDVNEPGAIIQYVDWLPKNPTGE